MSSTRRLLGFFSLCGAIALSLGPPVVGHAQVLTIGSPNVAVADPLIPRPPTVPCAVTLFTNQEFADFNSKPFTFTPAPSCPGPWQKVVLSADYNVTTGRQFDRTAEIWLGGAIIYFGTTEEPSSTVAPSWHIERDLTDYSALFTQAQTGHADLGNFVGTDSGVDYTGIYYGSATLYFYPVVGGVRQGELQPRPDEVLSLNSDPTAGTATLNKPGDQFVANFASLPTNIERAFLDVYAQGQSADEFWYFNLPNDIAAVFEDNTGTAYRETLVTIDGQPAGIAPIFPWIFTGGADPLLWRPIPGVQTLAFEAYRVDLTPFAGKLNDGKPHALAVSVYNSTNYFSVAGNLLLYLDHGASQVTGNVISNSLSATPVVNAVENVVQPDSTDASGTVLVTSNRQYEIVGSVNTSHGTVTTQVDVTMGFSSNQTLATSNTEYVQDTVQNTQISVTTTRVSGDDVSVVQEQRVYPLTFDYEDKVASDGTESLYTFVDQELQQQLGFGAQGGHADTATRDNHVVTTVTRHFDASGNQVDAPSSSAQLYNYADPYGACYGREITAQNELLTGAADGLDCAAGVNVLGWRDRFSQAASRFNGATIQLLP